MANYSTLKAAVADVVKTNGTQAITGANLQAVLLSIINSVGGGGYIFKGVATPSTDAGTPDQNVFYVGGAGTYANFGTSVTVPVGSIGVFKYNGSWAKEQIAIYALDDVPTKNSNNLVKSGGVYGVIENEDVKIWEIGNAVNRLEDGLQMDSGINLYDSSKQTSETISPHYYMNGVPYSTTQFDNSWNCTALIPIEPGTQYTLCMVPHPTSYTKPWGSAAQGLFAYDGDGNYLNFMTTDNTFTTPKYARYIRFNYYIGGNNITLAYLNSTCMLVKGSQTPSEYEKYKTDFGVIEELQNELDALNEFVECDIDSTITGKYISDTLGNIGTLDVYNIYLIDVSENIGELMQIKGRSKGLTSPIPAFAFYTSNQLSSSTAVSVSSECVKDTFDVTVTVPNGAVYLALSQEYSNASINFEQKAYTQEPTRLNTIEKQLNDIETSAIEYSKSGNSIVFGTGYKDKKIGVTFGQGGANDLVDFRNVFTYSPISSINDAQDVTYIIAAVGDMHAPFMFRSDDLTGSVDFTGGNHAYGTIKTATLEYVNFYVGGRLISDLNETGFCTNVKIEWANLVKAGNAYAEADDYALREKHSMTFDGLEFEEWIDLEPLTDIRMGVWYGLQLMPVVNQSYIMFANNTNVRDKKGVGADVSSGNRLTSMVIAGSPTSQISMSIDNNFDLGDRSLSSDSGAFFVNSTLKSYFRIIYDSDYNAIMQEGYHYWLHGWYNFNR